MLVNVEDTCDWICLMNLEEKKTPACKGIEKQASPKKRLLIMEKKTTLSSIRHMIPLL
jgi:hypothetical protein